MSSCCSFLARAQLAPRNRSDIKAFRIPLGQKKGQRRFREKTQNDPSIQLYTIVFVFQLGCGDGSFKATAERHFAFCTGTFFPLFGPTSCDQTGPPACTRDRPVPLKIIYSSGTGYGTSRTRSGTSGHSIFTPALSLSPPRYSTTARPPRPPSPLFRLSTNACIMLTQPLHTAPRGCCCIEQDVQSVVPGRERLRKKAAPWRRSFTCKKKILWM
jgi:hypothetical protein